MNTCKEDSFSDFMTEALPDLLASIMRDDRSAFSKGQLSVPQFWALHHISRKDGLTVNALARTMNRSKSSTSALLQRLEKAGLVKRTRSMDDQRMVNLSLTPRGRRMIERLHDARKDGINKTYAVLNTSERIQYCRIIKKVLRSIEKRTLVLILAAAAGSTALAQETTNHYSLTESVQIGLKQSLAVVNAARQREIAEATQKRALASAYPTLTGTANYSLYDPQNFTESGSTVVGAEASWEIFSGGKTLSAIRAAKSYRLLTTYQERRIRETQVRDIMLAYYLVQLTKTRVDVLAQSVRQLSDFEAETRSKFDAGAASEFEWLSARVSLVNEQPRLIAARNDLNLAREQFRNLIYLDDTPFELTDPLEFVPVKIELDEAISIGLGKRPELLEKESSIRLREEDINQQKSSYLPSIDLFANYNLYDPDPYSKFIPGSSSDAWQAHWGAGATATWTLFDGGLRKSNLSESRLNLAIEEDEYRDLIRSVSLDIRTQWLRGRDAAEVINATTENIDLATRALDIARTRFDAGLSTNLEVTQANLELSNAQLARSQAIYEFMVAVARIKHAAGILLEEFEDE